MSEASRGSLSSRVLSRSRFLAFAVGGAALAFLGTRAASSVGSWRYNTVEVPRPLFDLHSYRLTIDGLVEHPITFTYDELRGLPPVHQVSDFKCVEGWGVDDVRWDGVRLQSLIDMARPASSAGFITFHSLGEIYRDSLTMEQALLPDAMIAYDMDGAPLSPDHGLPLRLVMPRMFGYKGPKWLTRIEFRDRRDIGYWQTRGWKVDAWIPT
jgi:DMSO/TMAO reductase YedYZ molybdopterin-dependent catalytic subunit